MTHSKYIKKVTDQLRVPKVECCTEASKYLMLKVIPGNKICHNCEISLQKKIKCAKENDNSVEQSVESCNEGQSRRSERISKLEKISYNYSIVNPESQSSASTDTTASNSTPYTTLSQNKSVVNAVLNSLQLPNLDEFKFAKTKRLHDAVNVIHSVCTNLLM